MAIMWTASICLRAHFLIDSANVLQVGDMYLGPHEGDPRQASVGFTVSPQYHGKGFASEALTALLGHAFAGVSSLLDILMTISPAWSWQYILEYKPLLGHFFRADVMFCIG